MRPVTRPQAILLALLLAATGCAGPSPPHENDSAAAARRLFAMSRAGEPTDEQLHELFDADLLSERRVQLLDALAALGDVELAEAVEVHPLSGEDEVVVDLAGVPSGGGTARYSVQLRALEPGAWRIRWFLGPGVEWPGVARRDDGLTVSSAFE